MCPDKLLSMMLCRSKESGNYASHCNHSMWARLGLLGPFPPGPSQCLRISPGKLGFLDLVSRITNFGMTLVARRGTFCITKYVNFGISVVHTYSKKSLPKSLRETLGWRFDHRNTNENKSFSPNILLINRGGKPVFVPGRRKRENCFNLGKGSSGKHVSLLQVWSDQTAESSELWMVKGKVILHPDTILKKILKTKFYALVV